MHYYLEMENGASVVLSSFGARILKCLLPADDGQLDECILGYDTREEHDENGRWYGCIIGRVGGRIGGSKFKIDGVETQLDPCDEETKNHLNGGLRGFGHKYWDYDELEDGCEFTLTSEDGDQKYPGKINAKVTYTLAYDDEDNLNLKIQM